ncbi:hypothetical protein ACFSQQ_23135 [Mesorhizobium kowhaii]
MELGVTNRNGRRFGSRALRTIERVGPYEHVMKTSPLSKAKVADIGGRADGQTASTWLAAMPTMVHSKNAEIVHVGAPDAIERQLDPFYRGPDVLPMTSRAARARVARPSAGGVGSTGCDTRQHT